MIESVDKFMVTDNVTALMSMGEPWSKYSHCTRAENDRLKVVNEGRAVMLERSKHGSTCQPYFRDGKR